MRDAKTKTPLPRNLRVFCTRVSPFKKKKSIVVTHDESDEDSPKHSMKEDEGGIGQWIQYSLNTRR